MKIKQVPMLGALVVATGLLIGAPAFAGPTVTNWNYSTNASFLSATFGSGDGVTNGGTALPALDYELSWGSGTGSFLTNTSSSDNNRSALTIGKDTSANRTGGGPVTGSIVTDTDGTLPGLIAAEIGNGVTFTHWNNTLSSHFATLTGGTVHDTLKLTPTAPASGAPYDVPAIDFVFHFAETNNAGPCADGAATPCPDLFGIFGFSNFNQPFTYDGNNYFATIFVRAPDGSPTIIGLLNPQECAAIGFAAGCQGFRTAEGVQTTKQFAFAITTVPFQIPEPGSLALVGFALAGLGFALRRRAR